MRRWPCWDMEMEQVIEQTPKLLETCYCDFWLTTFHFLCKAYWRWNWQLSFCLKIFGFMAVILYTLAKYCKCSNIFFQSAQMVCTEVCVLSIYFLFPICPEKGQKFPSPTNGIIRSHGFHCEATSASFCKVFTLTSPPSLLYVPATSYKWPGRTPSLPGPSPCFMSRPLDIRPADDFKPMIL